MELINRYVHEVGQRLPSRIRTDVENELRSLLADSVDERMQDRPESAREEVVTGVLREFGKPEDVALRYDPRPQYLIGPRFYPSFIAGAKVLAVVSAVLAAIPVGIGIAAAPGKALEILSPGSLFLMARGIAGAAASVVASLVLVFAIMERVSQGSESKKKEDWNPKDLPPVEDPDRISTAGRVARIYLSFALLLLFALAPQWVGVLTVVQDTAVHVDYTSLGFRIPKLALEFWWAGAILMNVMLLRAGRWTRGTRWAELILGAAGSYITYLILAGSSRPDLDADFIREHWAQVPAASAAGLALALTILRYIAWASLGVGLFTSLITFAGRCGKLVRLYHVGRPENGAAVRA